MVPGWLPSLQVHDSVTLNIDAYVVLRCGRVSTRLVLFCEHSAGGVNIVHMLQ